LKMVKIWPFDMIFVTLFNKVENLYTHS